MLSSACTSNWPHALHKSQPDLELLNRPTNILVVVKDSREKSSLVPEERGHYCVGSINQMWGSPIPVMTADGYTLASGVGQSICDAFSSKGWQCYVEEYNSKSEIRNELNNYFSRYTATKLLFVNINNWFSKTGTTSTELEYKFGLSLWNRSMQLLGSVGEEGTRVFPVTSYLNPAENASLHAPTVLSEILSGLLKEPKIVSKF